MRVGKVPGGAGRSPDEGLWFGALALVSLFYFRHLRCLLGEARLPTAASPTPASRSGASAFLWAKPPALCSLATADRTPKPRCRTWKWGHAVPRGQTTTCPGIPTGPLPHRRVVLENGGCNPRGCQQPLETNRGAKPRKQELVCFPSVRRRSPGHLREPAPSDEGRPSPQPEE